jgi:hypothetical protein
MRSNQNPGGVRSLIPGQGDGLGADRTGRIGPRLSGSPAQFRTCINHPRRGGDHGFFMGSDRILALPEEILVDERKFDRLSGKSALSALANVTSFNVSAQLSPSATGVPTTQV